MQGRNRVIVVEGGDLLAESVEVERVTVIGRSCDVGGLASWVRLKGCKLQEAPIEVFSYCSRRQDGDPRQIERLPPTLSPWPAEPVLDSDLPFAKKSGRLSDKTDGEARQLHPSVDSFMHLYTTR